MDDVSALLLDLFIEKLEGKAGHGGGVGGVKGMFKNRRHYKYVCRSVVVQEIMSVFGSAFLENTSKS